VRRAISLHRGQLVFYRSRPFAIWCYGTLPFFFAALASWACHGLASPLRLLVVAALLLWIGARRGVTLDRKRRTVTKWWGLVLPGAVRRSREAAYRALPILSRTRSLARYRRVDLEEVECPELDERPGAMPATVRRLWLKGEGEGRLLLGEVFQHLEPLDGPKLDEVAAQIASHLGWPVTHGAWSDPRHSR
jgi:hypothetical protein